MTDDGERIAKVEVRVENLEQSESRFALKLEKLRSEFESKLEKVRSERMKLIIAALFMLASTLLAIFKNVLPF